MNSLATTFLLLLFLLLHRTLIPGDPCPTSGADLVYISENDRLRAGPPQRSLHPYGCKGGGHRGQARGAENLAVGALHHEHEVGFFCMLFLGWEFFADGTHAALVQLLSYIIDIIYEVYDKYMIWLENVGFFFFEMSPAYSSWNIAVLLYIRAAYACTSGT